MMSDPTTTASRWYSSGLPSKGVTDPRARSTLSESLRYQFCGSSPSFGAPQAARDPRDEEPAAAALGREPRRLAGRHNGLLDDLWYPIIVTPLSQFFATQATMNVVSGERYKVIPDGIIEYVAGYHGAPPAPVNQDVLDKIYRLPKAKKIIEEEFPQPSIAEIRKQMGIGQNVSDEELLLRYALSEDEVNAMLAADPD